MKRFHVMAKNIYMYAKGREGDWLTYHDKRSEEINAILWMGHDKLLEVDHTNKLYRYVKEKA